MANFQSIPGVQNILYHSLSGTFVMLSNTEAAVALWGGGPAGEDLIVSSRDPAIVIAAEDCVRVPPGPHLRRVNLTAKGDGSTSLIARLGKDGPVWAEASIVVGSSSKRNATATEGQIIRIGGLAMVAGGNQADFLRELYRKGNEELLSKAHEMIRGGKSETEAARWIVGARNDLKVEIRAKGPDLFKKIAEYRNQSKYGNPVGPSYETLHSKLTGKGVSPEEVDRMIIKGSQNTSQEFNAVGRRLRLVGTVGEVVGFALTATQNSPASLPPLPKSEADLVEIERVRLRLGIPAGANIDRHGHLKKGSYLQVDLFDPHIGDETAQETEEILWFLGVPITYRYQGATWTVPGSW